MKQAGIFQSNVNLFTESKDSGFLIAFEGPDGSGKSTQRKLMKAWLRNLQEQLIVSKWGSSPRFKPLIKAGKAAHSLNPARYACLHTADFWHRYESTVRPALENGLTVLADRYVFTGLARDVARGLNPDWCTHLYAGARRPDLVFYFRANVTTCARRIVTSREIKFYEAGQDVTGIDDAYQSYLRFMPNVIAGYEELHRQHGFVIVDAERPIYEQHQFIRESYLNRRSTIPSAGYTIPSHPFLATVDV